jgi:uncharacterized protein YdgA (DUF945 family)
MRKSLVAVSVIVAACAAWTGASWFTGKLIEQRMDEVVNNVNSQLQSFLPKTGAKLGYEHVQRCIFSSKIRYVLRSDSSAPTDAKALNPSDEVAFLATIEHGPFPFAQLKKFNLLPSMATAHIKLENTTAVRNLFDITKGKSPFNAISRISYSGDTSSAINITPLEYPIGNYSLKLSGGTLNADVSRDMTAIVLDANNASAVFIGPNGFDQTEQISVHGISLKRAHHASQFDIDLGDQTITMKHFKLSVDGRDILALDGVNLVSKFGEQGNNINGQIDYTLDALKIQGNDFGAGKLTLKIDNIEGNSLKKFINHYNQQALDLLQHGHGVGIATYERQTTDVLLQHLQLLLKNNPTISVAPLSWKNNQGESRFTLYLSLIAPSHAVSLDQLITRSIKKLDAHLTIPLNMATETTTQAARLQGYTEDDARKLAQQQVQELATMSQMFKLATQKDNVISSNLYYVDSKFDLNGSEISLQEFMSMFGLPRP